jgi:hypothetical protein
MAQLTPPTTVESKFILWLKWTAAFVLAEAIMLPVMQYVPAFLIKLFPLLNTYPNAIRLPVIILNGFVYGLFSAMAIRSYLPNFRLWIILSSTVWMIGSIVSISPVIQSQLNSSSASTIFGIIASLVTLVPHGVIQWLMLRTRYQKAGFLILWYFMAGVVINLIFGLLFTYVPAVSTFLSSSSYWIIWGFNLVVEFSLFGITGIGIILVLKAPYSDTSALAPERRSLMEMLVRWVLYTLVFITVFSIFQAAGWLSFFTTHGVFSTPPWDALLVGLIYGLVLGTMQFLFFRPKIDQAYLWIIASIIGGGLLYISQSAGAHTDLLTGSRNQPAIYLILAFQALGWLALGVCQAVILNLWQYSKAWAWVLITFAGYGLAYLVQFFISQRLGMVLLPVLTGLGLLYIMRAEEGKTWFVAPVNPLALSPDDYETLRFILQARLNDIPGKKMNVSTEGNRLAIPSVDLSLSDTLTSLLTQPGKVSIYQSTGQTRIPDATPPVLTGEDFVSASLKREDEPDQQLIQLTLAEECAGRLNAEPELDPDAGYYLYVDGEPIHKTPLEISNEVVLKIRHLDAEDACYYCAILNNDALPFAVSLDKEDSEALAE